MRFFLSLIMILMINSIAFSQPWMDNLTEEQQNNFHEIQRSFYKYWEGKDMTQYKGWKQFKRWEWYWEPRVDENGNFPSSQHYWNELKKINKSKDPVLNAGGWEFAGPDDSNGGYAGLGRVNCVVVHPTNSNEIWAGSAAGGLWKSTNGGTSWTTNTDELDALGITDIVFDPSNSNVMYIATGDRDGSDTQSIGVLKSTNGGASWSATGLDYDINQRLIIYRLIIDPNDGDVLFAAVKNSGIFRTTNGGDSWQNVVSSGNYKDMEFKPGSSSIIYASGSKIIKTGNGGDNWFDLAGGLPASANRIAIAVSEDDDNVVYALYSSGGGLDGIYRSDDAGQNWTQVADDSPNYLHWDVNGNGSGGQGWYDLCIAASPDDVNEVFIGGINVWRSTNAGSSWEISTFWYGGQGPPAVHADQHDLWYDNNGKLWLGNDGGVYNTTDGGDSWNWLGRTLEITQFYRFGVSQNNADLFIGGAQDNGTKLFTNGNWVDKIGGDGFEAIVDPTDDNVIYASLYYGDIFKSTNGGQNFSLINSQNGQDYDDIDESGAWLTPYILDPNNTDIMYIGMTNIFKSTDGGTSFTKYTSGSGSKLRAIAIAPSNSNVLYCANNSQVFRSSNGGQNWTQVSRPGNQTITYLSVSDNDPDMLYASNSGYSSTNKVFYSTDGGDTWNNISSGLPNLPVNCVYYADPDNNRIYVGTDVGIYYRDDNTPNWVSFSEDLPNVDVTEIEINHDAQRIYAATYGRGIWFRDLDVNVGTPTLTSPSNNSKAVHNNSLKLEWNTVANAQKYHVQVASDQNFSSLVYNNNNVTATDVTVTSLDYYTSYYWRVSAINGGTQSDWANAWTFKTRLEAPTNVEPESNEDGVAINIELVWTQVTGAQSYHIQIAEDISFQDIYMEDSLSDNNLELMDLEHNKEYYWKVRAYDADGASSWSISSNFITTIDKTQLVAPADSSLKIEPARDFSWTTVDGATKYLIQFSTKSDFSTIAYSLDDIQETSVELTNLKYGMKYFWRVRAYKNLIAAAWSDVYYFTTALEDPVLISPNNGTTGNSRDIKLNWEDQEFAITYRLQVSKDSNFDEVVIDESQVQNNTFGTTGLEYNTEYFWRVKSFTQNDSTDWSAAFSFRTELPIVVLSTPAHEQAGVEQSGELVWEQAQNVLNYNLQLSENSNFNTTIIDENTDQLSYAFDGLEKSKNYYWKVRAVQDDEFGDWSNIFAFTTIVDRPVLKSPNDGDTINTTSTQLLWNEIENSDNYLIQVSDNDQFNNSITDLNNIINTGFLQDALEFDKQYFWRVAAIVNGQQSEWSDVWSFYVVKEDITIGIPELLSPENSSEGNEIDVFLKWESVETATSYNVELSASETFPNGSSLLEESTDKLQASYSGLENNKQYYWRVNAANSEITGEWSEVWSFKTKQSTSINELNLNGTEITISPNPASDVLMINYYSEDQKEYQISIIDIDGNVIFETEQLFISNNSISINIDNFSSGVYLIRFVNGRIKGELKFVKI